MWPRTQLDIAAADFLFAARQILAARARPADEEVVGTNWIPPDEALVCLSVRTGLDLLLSALNWPPGSEIVMSAVTIPDMPRIVEQHRLVPVSIAVDADRLQPSPDDLERAITPRTRTVLIAHLFGSCVDMEPIVAIAHHHNLLAVEDCAQTYIGPSYAGHPDSDAALFSFGPIKTATALGGAVLRVRNRELLDRMVDIQRAYPRQPRSAFAARLAKYMTFTAVGQQRAFGAVVRGLQLLGIDFDRAFAGIAHSFGSHAFFQQIRRQPCTPLKQLLARRLATFGDNNRLHRRRARGLRLVSRFAPHTVLGALNPTHSYWVLPVRIARSARVLTLLRAAGFDATTRSSLVVVPPATGDPCENADRLAPWLRETVFLPNGDNMPDSEFDRMLAVLHTALCRRKLLRDSHYPSNTRVPART